MWEGGGGRACVGLGGREGESAHLQEEGGRRAGGAAPCPSPLLLGELVT